MMVIVSLYTISPKIKGSSKLSEKIRDEKPIGPCDIAVILKSMVNTNIVPNAIPNSIVKRFVSPIPPFVIIRIIVVTTK
jgi:hypothetical protein